ncbi:hypothetical protein BCON_0060g00300 [Botryotinia convoluta]|uniref:Uncharacterized protein n=1 Tax=Botryotinia convoluta TaxID=54673 RepID=A0A4Z1I968_9HELO|nr:hypothetical protein BCON_0060g00300 [Botryotinia convoluta]
MSKKGKEVILASNQRNMVSEQSEKMSRKPPLTLQSTNRLMKKSKSKLKSDIVSSTSLSQSSKRKTENLKHTQDQHQKQQQYVSEQEQEIEQELDIIGTLTFERAQLEERVLGLEKRVRELEMQGERDVRMILWMRVEMARF